MLVALWCAGVLLLNFPMLIVFDKPATVFGLPLLPVALFAVWALLIGALALAMERSAPGPAEAAPPEASPTEGVAPGAGRSGPDAP